MACGSQRERAVPGVCPNHGGGVAVANVDAGGGSLWLAGKIGWLAFQASSQVDEPQPVDGVADCVVLECGLRPAVRRAGGGVHVADDDGGEHGYLAVCLGQGLQEGFCCVAEGSLVLMTFICHPSLTSP